VAGAVVILAIAGNGQIGIDGEVVFRFAGQRVAIIFLAGDFGAQFIPARHRPAHDIADAPVEARFRIANGSRCWRSGHKNYCEIMGGFFFFSAARAFVSQRNLRIDKNICEQRPPTINGVGEKMVIMTKINTKPIERN